MALAQPYAIPMSPFDTTFDSSTAGSGDNPWWPSSCSSDTGLLPPPHNPPLAEDWDRYKSVILQLYETLNLPLSAVRRRMEEQYGFVASPRMFKARFAPDKWNVKKNYSDEDILQWLEDDEQGLIHGKPVRDLRVQRHIRSKGFQHKVKKQKDSLDLTNQKANRARRASVHSMKNEAKTPETSSSNFTPLLRPSVVSKERYPTRRDSVLSISSDSITSDAILMEPLVSSAPAPAQLQRPTPRRDSLLSHTSSHSDIGIWTLPALSSHPRPLGLPLVSSTEDSTASMVPPPRSVPTRRSTIPRSVDTSSMSIYSGSKAFVMLQNYLETRLFSADHLEHFFGPVNLFPPDSPTGNIPNKQTLSLHPSLLNQNYARAMALLRNGRPHLASAILAQASTALEHLVEVHHPAFPSCFLDAFVELKFESQKVMSSYVSDLAVNTALKTLGPDHPITVLCHFVQSTARDEVSMEQLLFFCARFSQLFSKRLGKDHKISAYVNLKYFEKLLQLRRLEDAYTQFVDHVEPAFASILSLSTPSDQTPTASTWNWNSNSEPSSSAIPRPLRAATLCYLRRKAHLLSLKHQRPLAEQALRTCVNFAVEWLSTSSKISVAGNPLMEECFRLIDEIAEFLFRNGHTEKGIDLHSFAIGLAAAVRGECEGKAIRMFSAQLVRYKEAGFDDRVRILCVRFPSASIIIDDHDGEASKSTSSSTRQMMFDSESEDEGETLRPSEHILRCPTCANGPDTQLWCEQHRLQEKCTPQDRVFVRLARECLEDLLKWFGISTGGWSGSGGFTGVGD